MPSMGATVNELTVIALKTQAGDRITKGQRLADLESDKSVFEFESPCEGTIRAVLANTGDVVPVGAAFLRIETSDTSLRHLETRNTEDGGQKTATAPAAGAPYSVPHSLVWTPRATKMVQEAGLDPAKIADIEATGPGGRVSGDDVARYFTKIGKK